MFIDNKYTRWYFSIIAQAHIRVNSLDYYEKHHIIPKSLGGGNGSNVVKLSAKEHFVCHRLLPKMMVEPTHKYKMLYALFCMTRINAHHKRKKVSGRLYEQIRGDFSTAQRQRWKDPFLKMKASVRQTQKWKDPKYRQKMTEMSRCLWEDPDHRTKASIRATEYWKDPDHRSKQAEKQKLISQDPLVKEKKIHRGSKNGMFGKTHTNEVKEKLAKLRKEELTGKSYEERHGFEKAQQLKQSRSQTSSRYMRSKNTTGTNNSNAKHFAFIDPSGNRWDIAGGLISFCKTHSLRVGGMIDLTKRRRSEYKGWTIPSS